MGAVFKKEFKGYFTSPLGYIFLAVMLFFSGQAFTYVLSMQSSYLSYVFASMFSIITMIIPVLTMRLLSEDKKLKTDQLLLTAPVRTSGVVVGKYLAALCVYLISISITIVYAIIMATFTTPDWNIFLGNIIAIALLGAALISIGLFISALTENQMVAAIATFATMMVITMFDTLAQQIPASFPSLGFLDSIVSFFANFIKQAMISVSFMGRYADFMEGIIDISHVIFFISVAVLFNFLTVRVLDRKRWS